MPPPPRSCVACKNSKTKCDFDPRSGKKCTRCARIGLRCEQAVPIKQGRRTVGHVGASSVAAVGGHTIHSYIGGQPTCHISASQECAAALAAAAAHPPLMQHRAGGGGGAVGAIGAEVAVGAVCAEVADAPGGEIEQSIAFLRSFVLRPDGEGSPAPLARMRLRRRRAFEHPFGSLPTGAGLAGVHAALQRGGRAEPQLVRRDERRDAAEMTAEGRAETEERWAETEERCGRDRGEMRPRPRCSARGKPSSTALAGVLRACSALGVPLRHVLSMPAAGQVRGRRCGTGVQLSSPDCVSRSELLVLFVRTSRHPSLAGVRPRHSRACRCRSSCLSLPATLPEPSRRPVLQGAAGPLELPGDAQAMLHCSAGYVHVRHLRDGAPPLAAEDVCLDSSQRSRGHALRRRATGLCCPHCTRTPLVLTRCS